MSQHGVTDTKAQLEDTYARSTPSVSADGARESCGWDSCNGGSIE